MRTYAKKLNFLGLSEWDFFGLSSKAEINLADWALFSVDLVTDVNLKIPYLFLLLALQDYMWYLCSVLHLEDKFLREPTVWKALPREQTQLVNKEMHLRRICIIVERARPQWSVGHRLELYESECHYYSNY